MTKYIFVIVKPKRRFWDMLTVFTVGCAAGMVCVATLNELKPDKGEQTM